MRKPESTRGALRLFSRAYVALRPRVDGLLGGAAFLRAAFTSSIVATWALPLVAPGGLPLPASANRRRRTGAPCLASSHNVIPREVPLTSVMRNLVRFFSDPQMSQTSMRRIFVANGYP